MKTAFRIISLALLVSVLAAACAVPAPQVVEKVVTQVVEKEKVVEKPVVQTVVVQPTAEPAAAPAPGPAVKDRELTIAVQTYPDGIDPHQCNYNNCFIISRKVADTLVARGPNNEIKPFLATSWEASPDGKSYTFKLRDDVKFHDGTPFNAEAVKANFDRIVDPATKSKLAINYLGPYDGAEVIDEYTIKINFKEPYAPFFNVFAGYIPMLSPASFDRPLEESNWAPIGSGPWKFEKLVPNDSVVLVKNPDYNWAPEIFQHQGPPYIDVLTFRFIREDATRAAVLQNGEVQAVYGVPEASLATFKAETDKYWIQEAVMPGPGVHYVFNAGRAPTDDVKLRQALMYATDQEMILKTVYLGQGLPLKGLLSSVTSCYDEAANTMYSFDMEKAKALLDEAGWLLNEKTGFREKDGKRLTVGITSVAVGKGPEIGEVVQALWASLGIDARNITLPNSAVQVPTAQSGDFDVIWRDFGATDPNILSTLFHGKNIGPGKGWNFSHLVLPDLDALLDKGDVTVDQTERCKVYAEAQKIIQENALTIPIRPRLIFLGGLPQVHDLQVDPAIGSGELWIYDAYVGTK